MQFSGARNALKAALSINWSVDDLSCVSRGPTSLVEPSAVLLHFRALRRGSVALASRGFITLVRRAPSELDTVVRVVRHLEIGHPVEDVFECERPFGTVAARVREFTG